MKASGHDWWHMYRVWQLSKTIAKAESADTYKVELAALLHDIADWKYNDGDEEAGPNAAREWLESLSVESNAITAILEVVRHISYKGGSNKYQFKINRRTDRPGC